MQKTHIVVPKVSLLRTGYSSNPQIRQIQFETHTYLTQKHRSLLSSPHKCSPRKLVKHSRPHHSPQPSRESPLSLISNSTDCRLGLRGKKTEHSALQRKGRKRQIDWSALDPFKHVSRFNPWQLKFYRRVKHKLKSSELS